MHENVLHFSTRMLGLGTTQLQVQTNLDVEVFVDHFACGSRILFVPPGTIWAYHNFDQAAMS